MNNNEGWTLLSNKKLRKSNSKNNQSKTITGFKKIFTKKLKAARNITDLSITIDGVKSYIKKVIKNILTDI